MQKKSCITSGFTLIELLVVVLIIGILAAIALPQYQKAVLKAKVTEAISIGNALEKSMDLYVLEHGYAYGEFVGNSEYRVPTGIDVELKVDEAYGPVSKDFQYFAACMSSMTIDENDNDIAGCQWGADYLHSIDGGLFLSGERPANESRWAHYCESCSDSGPAHDICQTLYAQGWQDGDKNC